MALVFLVMLLYPRNLPSFPTGRSSDLTSSGSITPVPSGQPVLFADDYGFHYGDVWYRGRYSGTDRKSTRLNSSHLGISYAVFCLKKKNKHTKVMCYKKKTQSTPPYTVT